MARRRFVVLCVVLLTLYGVGASDDAVEPRADDARAFGEAGITNLRVGTEESPSPSAVFSMRRRHSPPTPGALAHLREHDAHRRLSLGTQAKVPKPSSQSQGTANNLYIRISRHRLGT